MEHFPWEKWFVKSSNSCKYFVCAICWKIDEIVLRGVNWVDCWIDFWDIFSKFKRRSSREHYQFLHDFSVYHAIRSNEDTWIHNMSYLEFTFNYGKKYCLLCEIVKNCLHIINKSRFYSIKLWVGFSLINTFF